jgi:hypothetical protein
MSEAAAARGLKAVGLILAMDILLFIFNGLSYLSEPRLFVDDA